ncbi:hypothetical protein D3C80_1664880 [compost metagenome]
MGQSNQIDLQTGPQIQVPVLIQIPEKLIINLLEDILDQAVFTYRVCFLNRQPGFLQQAQQVTVYRSHQ